MKHVVVVGAGAAGLVAARELGRAGKRVTIIEARDRCGGRIDSLSTAEFGYPAEGGAEFVHGEAPVTRALLREAKISLQPFDGTQWTVTEDKLSPENSREEHETELHVALSALTNDLTVGQFLRQHFGGPEYSRLRQSVVRMVEGYDAADPEQASILALRDEWMDEGDSTQVRVAGGYKPLIDFLVTECRSLGVDIRLGASVKAIESTASGAVVRCTGGDAHECDQVVLTVPLPLLKEITLPRAEQPRAAAAGNIGFGNVIKILMRFETRWWVNQRADLADLTFVLSEAKIPVWWTQHPVDVPVLTGWFGGPRTAKMAGLNELELIDAGLASLASIFGRDLSELQGSLVTARAIDWANDPFARGAYSYATVDTRAAQSLLSRPNGGPILFSGEAIYRGKDMGTVEAALASGLEAAHTILRVE